MGLSAFIAGVTAVLKIIEIIQQLGALAQKREFTQWLDDLSQTVKDMEAADDLRKKLDAARRLVDLTRRVQ